MSKPQCSSRTTTLDYLTQDQILCLLAVDLDTGEVCAQGDAIPPGWLLVECYDLGLVTPGERPGVWKLSPDGWDARVALLADRKANSPRRSWLRNVVRFKDRP